MKVELGLKFSFSTYLPKSRMCFLTGSSVKFSGSSDLSSSPLRKNQGKEPFDKHISKLLQRTTSQPLMKGATGAQLSNVECLKILTRSTKVWFLFSGSVSLLLLCLIRIHSSLKCVSPLCKCDVIGDWFFSSLEFFFYRFCARSMSHV